LADDGFGLSALGLRQRCGKEEKEMPLLWTDDLSVGVDRIDEQHKELLRRINGLLEAMKQGKGKSQLDEVLAFLDEYVVIHFGTEETYMRRYSYPDYLAHRKAHVEFRQELAVLKKQLETAGATSVLVIEVQNRLGSWFREHVKKVDMLMGEFLKTKPA
jgi:hemerythrin